MAMSRQTEPCNVTWPTRLRTGHVVAFSQAKACSEQGAASGEPLAVDRSTFRGRPGHQFEDRAMIMVGVLYRYFLSR